MPITSAARLASLASSSVQRPRAPVRYERGFMDSARWTPVTSWPASAALAAATAESTPPDMAASTRSRFIAYEGIRPADVTGALPGYGVAGFQPGGQLAEAPCAAPPAGHDAPGHPVKRRRAWWPGYGSARRGAAGPLHYLTDR